MNIPTDPEGVVRFIAEKFPTPNVLRSLALCESGRLPWDSVATMLAQSVAKAVKEVS